ncbi:MAG TPA: prolipoprotein diacylglyceryl transferase family protein [Gemmatimonadaceae bacterium]|nr:prolipoprotein diacylglyceryl transferase family protein [Gemmatimonadaceae bacterium]
MIVHQPFQFSIGDIQITGFGLAVLLGFVIAQIVAQRELARKGHDPTPIGDLIFWAAAGSLISAKVYYAILVGDASALFSRGGFVFWGGLIGGIVTVSIVIIRKNLPFFRIAEVAGPAIAAAYAVGRTGCWAVGDDYGRPWNGPLAVQFPQGAPPSTVAIMQREFGTTPPPGSLPTDVLAVHPTQLYETAMAMAMFFILWRLRGHRHAEGWLFGVYMVLAGLERFIVEFFRAKDDRFFGIITLAQIFALGFVIFGGAWMVWRRGSGMGNREPGIA